MTRPAIILSRAFFGGWIATALFLLPIPIHALDVFVLAPRPGEVVFGEVEIRLELLSAPEGTVVAIRVDGEEVAHLDGPPWITSVDVGQDNRRHLFEIVATDPSGGSATQSVETGAIEVHEEVDLGLQQLYVTATRGGKRVLDLRQLQFTVRDDGLAQNIVTFERGDVPLTAALLVDSSSSMSGAPLRAALRGARAFVEGMAELDEAKLLVFSDRLLATTPFGDDPASVEEVMSTVEASGGTALHDHLYLALAELEARQGRRVVILLSDGIDVESILSMQDVLWKARRTSSLVYWIRLGGEPEDVGGYVSIWRNPESHARELGALADLVRESGGRIIDLVEIEQATGAFRELLRELREQYVIGYYPSNDRNDGAWHEIDVSAPGVRLRHRDGYLDEAR